jgi:hypothetical protein
LSLAAAAAANETDLYRILNLSETPGSSREPAIADASDRTIVAWEESGAGIITRGVHADMIDSPIPHGPGRDPALCSASGRVILAFARDDAIVIREWLGQEWSAPVVLATGMGFPTACPEFGVRLDTADEPVYLVWSEERRSLETDIWFTEWVSGAWQTPVRIRERIAGAPEFVCAQVEPAAGAGDDEPRVYWFGNEVEILYVARNAGQWSTPVAVPGSFGPLMEVTAGPDGLHHILTNGPQPTCPCNVMLYLAETATGWTAPDNIMVPMDEYTWPRYPALRMDGRGVAHAFWYQSAYDFMMQPSGEAMFYFARTGDLWQDQSALFEMHSGIDNALSVRGYPLFAWVEGDAGSEEIFIAVPGVICSVAGAGAAPESARSITAFPNPFGAATRITIAGVEGALPRIGVFDVTGRRVADVTLTAGKGAMATWNGRNARGQPCPAGEYWLVLPNEGELLVSRVTLVR